MRNFRLGTAVALFVLAGLVALRMPQPAGAFTNPTITSVSPGNGPSAGGTQVTITGTNFLSGAQVFFGGAPSSAVTVQSGTQLLATTPRGTTGSANVLVTNADGGAVTLNSAFFYTDPASVLTLAGLSATDGPTRGGTAVTLTGTGFQGSIVLFGGTPATAVNVLGPSAISLRTPPGAPGPVTVSVRNSDGTSTSLPNAFVYDAGGLEVTAITPLGGIASGGTVVRISGNAFALGTTVSFGGIAATNVAVVNSTLIIATAPALPAGTVAIIVTTPAGASASLANVFTARTSTGVPGLTISSISPATGSGVGGTTVTIVGSGFTGGASVLFGGIPATNVTAPSPSTIFATAPLNVTGSVPLTVITSDGASVTLPSAYSYTGSSGFAVNSAAPSVGPATGGTVVAITGSGFVTGASVSFGGVQATNVWVLGDGEVYATTPAGATGAAAITVTNPGGLPASLTNGFTFGAGGTVTPPSVSSGLPLPGRGFAVFVFGGGSNDALVAASGCLRSTVAFWVTTADGAFATFLPGTSIAAVNAEWNAMFAALVPAGTAMIGRCS